jgi:hypothetical protein
VRTGRPATETEIVKLVLRFAKENGCNRSSAPTFLYC